MHIQVGLVNNRLSRRLSKLEIEMVPPEPLEEFTVSHTASWGLNAGRLRFLFGDKQDEEPCTVG